MLRVSVRVSRTDKFIVTEGLFRMSVLNTKLERQSQDGLDMELPDRRKSGKPQRREGGHAAGWSDRGGC